MFCEFSKPAMIYRNEIILEFGYWKKPGKRDSWLAISHPGYDGKPPQENVYF